MRTSVSSCTTSGFSCSLPHKGCVYAPSVRSFSDLHASRHGFPTCTHSNNSDLQNLFDVSGLSAVTSYVPSVRNFSDLHASPHGFPLCTHANHSDLQKLFDAAGLSADDRAAVNNLNALDVAVTSDQHRTMKDFPRKRRSTEGGVHDGVENVSVAPSSPKGSLIQRH